DGVDIDLSRLLARDPDRPAAYCGSPALQPPPRGLAARLDAALARAIERGGGGVHRDTIRNTDRSIGARLSGLIARHHGNTGMSRPRRAGAGPVRRAAYGGSSALQPPPRGPAARLDAALARAIEHGGGGVHRDTIRNTDRSIGARLSGLIARHHGNTGMSRPP